MIDITPVPVALDPIRLSLDQILTVNLAALLPEGVSFLGMGASLSDDDVDTTLRDDWDAAEGTARLYAAADSGFLVADAENPDAVVGNIYVYTSLSMAPYIIPLLAAFDTTADPADLRGTAGRDCLTLDMGADDDAPASVRIDTSGGSDRAQVIGTAAVMLGRAGDDTLIGWDRSDAIYGGGGEDRLEGHGGDDRMIAHRGDDTLIGGAGGDVLFGGDGNDLLEGGEGDDRLSADAGFDTLRSGAGDNVLFAADTRTSGIEVRIAAISDAQRPAFLGYGGIGDDAIYGGTGASTLFGGAGEDYISAESLNGGMIYAGLDDDQIYAGIHNPNNDGPLPDGAAPAPSFVFGGMGNDYLSIWGGDAAVVAGDGNDTVYASGVISGETGDDTVYVTHGFSALVYGGGATTPPTATSWTTPSTAGTATTA